MNERYTLELSEAQLNIITIVLMYYDLSRADSSDIPMPKWQRRSFNAVVKKVINLI